MDSDFKTYFMGLSVAERDDFAARCKTSRQHLTNIAYAVDPKKKPGEGLCIAIERESGGAVRCETLRQDIDFGFLRKTCKEVPACSCQKSAAEAPR